jgi:hypothetical protein
MSSLSCPECRQEMIAQKDYDQALCSECGRTVYVPGKKFQKIICVDCEDQNSGGKRFDHILRK